MKTQGRPVCPQCGKAYGVRIRLRTGELTCNICGYIGKIKKDKLIKKE